MKQLFMALTLTIAAFSMSVEAADMTCETRAADKHLAGAAKTSFMTKCEKQAQASSAKEQCDAQAAEKKLHGAAKSSFTKKCVTDAAK